MRRYSVLTGFTGLLVLVVGCSTEPKPKVILEAEPTVVQVECINFGGVGKIGTVDGVRAKAYEVYYWSDGSKTFTPLPIPRTCP